MKARGDGEQLSVKCHKSMRTVDNARRPWKKQTGTSAGLCHEWMAVAVDGGWGGSEGAKRSINRDIGIGRENGTHRIEVSVQQLFRVVNDGGG